jgi:hypothetical protein
VPYSEVRRSRLREFYAGWSARLAELPFESLDLESRIDHVLLRNEIAYQISLLEREERMAAEMSVLLPFAGSIASLQESRRDLDTVDPAATAQTLASLISRIDDARRGAEAGADAGATAGRDGRSDSGRFGARHVRATSVPAAEPIRATRIVAFRAARVIDELRQTLQGWYRFYAGYDPLFTWWTAEPYGRVDAALESYSASLRERVVGIRSGEEEPIIGDPIGADGLQADLRYELIPYTPAELVAIADGEFRWTEAEMRRAAADMGLARTGRPRWRRSRRGMSNPADRRSLPVSWRWRPSSSWKRGTC